MKKLNLLLLSVFAFALYSRGQITYPVNGVADPRTGYYVFTNATIVKDASTTVQNATLVIKEGKIVAVGPVTVPKDAVLIDCKGKYIYPSFIDMYSDYGVTAPQKPAGGGNFWAQVQFTSNKTGPYNWNQAIKSEVNAVETFAVNDKQAAPLREIGFGTVLSHVKDGIARGTGVVATLANQKENLLVIKDKAAAFYSFSKGSSTQSYPGSMMGAVALLRQTYLDALWYKNKPVKEGLNKTLEAWNGEQSLPQIFESGDKWSSLRADRIGKEFNIQYIIKAGGNEYQRMAEIAATKAPFILSLNFPDAQKVDDPADARFVAWTDLANWELAPTNPAAFEKAKIIFALTVADLKDPKQFWPNLRKAIQNGLSEKTALEALTKVPATLLKISDHVGSLQPGMLANFIITDGTLFSEKTNILENWVQGNRFNINANTASDKKGTYRLAVAGTPYVLNVKSNNAASITGAGNVRFAIDEKQVAISFSLQALSGKDSAAGKNTTGNLIRLSGIIEDTNWQGVGYDDKGNPITWTAVKQQGATAEKDSAARNFVKPAAQVVYPFSVYGNAEQPKTETILIRNATVWTNEKEGKLENTDVLVKEGKIIQVGKGLNASGATIIDGTGKHLTPGIIDEHSHIAVFSINEGTQSVTSEVRIGDNLNPDDINIYRQLSGGVTTSHILHGSANTIGGQTQLIKLRWGADAEGLKFKGADPFIKFALGENVKRTASVTGNNRYPDTRMGVFEVLRDAFQRAKDYEKAMKSGNKEVRRDLELDALVEILNNKRFITCHSYVQSEILGLINVAETYGFKVNTFTHILEGYKVADRIKQHGASVSTFSDWWAYKNEVRDAIPYNAAIMQKLGLNVCINSDDAEMARRLNQEAAKTIKYGGVTEEEALKMVTLNPAKALHVDKQVGSIKAGKDADLVLWSDNPLSIYAKALYTIVDGAIYFDLEKDMQHRAFITVERNRLIQKMLNAGKAGAAVTAVKPTPQVILHCDDYEHKEGILTVDAYDFQN